MGSSSVTRPPCELSVFSQELHVNLSPFIRKTEVRDVAPDKVRVGQVVEAAFSLRGVRISNGKRIVRNHMSSVMIVSRKGLPVLIQSFLFCI